MSKCKHWNYCMLDADLQKSAKCRGKDSRCNIIPKKPKMVGFRAWAEFVPDNGYCLPWMAWKKSDRYNIPCTILIDEKYLRRKP